MVMVPGERKLELTLTVVGNYNVPQLQPVDLPRAGPKAPSMWLHDRKWEQSSSRTGLPCRSGQTLRSHIDWNCLIVQHPRQEMVSYVPVADMDIQCSRRQASINARVSDVVSHPFFFLSSHPSYHCLLPPFNPKASRSSECRTFPLYISPPGHSPNPNYKPNPNSNPNPNTNPTDPILPLLTPLLTLTLTEQGRGNVRGANCPGELSVSQGSSCAFTFILEEVVDVSVEPMVECDVDYVVGRRVGDVVLLSGAQLHAALDGALRQHRVDATWMQPRLRRTQVNQREIDELSGVDGHRPCSARLAAARRRQRRCWRGVR